MTGQELLALRRLIDRARRDKITTDKRIAGWGRDSRVHRAQASTDPARLARLLAATAEGSLIDREAHAANIALTLHDLSIKQAKGGVGEAHPDPDRSRLGRDGGGERGDGGEQLVEAGAGRELVELTDKNNEAAGPEVVGGRGPGRKEDVTA